MFLVLTAQASATSVSLTGSITNADYPGYGPTGGSFTVNFDVSGLPVSYSDDPGQYGEVALSNVSATAALDDGSTYAGTGGYGSIEQETYHYNYLDFFAGPISGLLLVSSDYTGTGPVYSFDDLGDTTLVRINSTDFYFNGGESTAVTPEPTSLSLALLGLSLVIVGSGKLNRLRTFRR